MVISTVNQVVYNGDGVTTEWPFTFKIIDASDIKLSIIEEDGRETAITSDFYVNIVNNTVYYPGYAPGAEPPLEDRPPKLQSGQRLIVYRQIPITQEKALGDKWPFASIEKALDKLTMILQQVFGFWDRCFKISESAAATHPDFDMTLPIENGKTFRVNDAGTGFESATDPSIAAAAAEAAAEAAEALANDKADKATTLAGYGITDAYTKTAADNKFAQKATTLSGYGITDVYTSAQTDSAISTGTAGKADKATTLSGYGITDAYTKMETATELDERAYKNNNIPVNLVYPNALSQTINGVAWTVNDDGTVTATGTASGGNSDFRCISLWLPAGDYIVSGCAANGSSSTYDIYVQEGNVKGTGISPTPIARDYGIGETSVNSFTLSEGNYIYVTCRVFNNKTVCGLTFRPMIRPASVKASEFHEYIPTPAELEVLYKDGGKRIAPCNDATMTDIANCFATYAQFFKAAMQNSGPESTRFSYGGTIYRLWDNNFTPAKDSNNKYQMSCSVLGCILLYGITYDNSAYGTPGRNILSPLGYQSKDLYDQICYTDSENNLSYFSSQHLCRWCVERGYAFYPKADMSDLQPGDLLFYNVTENGAHVNRVFYMQISHCDTVAWRISDDKLVVFDGGSLTVCNKFSVRTAAYLAQDLVIAARVPRPNSYEISYENLLTNAETNATATTTAGQTLLKEYHPKTKLKKNHVYTLIARISAADITKVYPVIDTSFYGLGLDSMGPGMEAPNNIYVLPFIPNADTSTVTLRMRHNDTESVGVSTVDKAVLIEGLVAHAPEWFYERTDNHPAIISAATGNWNTVNDVIDLAAAGYNLNQYDMMYFCVGNDSDTNGTATIPVVLAGDNNSYVRRARFTWTRSTGTVAYITVKINKTAGAVTIMDTNIGTSDNGIREVWLQ